MGAAGSDVQEWRRLERFGLSNTITVVGAIVGPAIAGWARDVTGSFALGLYVSAAMALAGGLTLVVFRRSGRARPSAA